MEGFISESHRPVIERKDFPLSWRGYNGEEVDRHLHFVADLLAGLEDAEAHDPELADEPGDTDLPPAA